jgi:hypothetical protein
VTEITLPDSPKDRSPVWSRDFVEHIRTVHFSMVAVCLALIGLLQFQKPKDYSVAQHQLAEIKTAADAWDSQQVSGTIRAALMSAGAMPSMPGPDIKKYEITSSDQYVAFISSSCVFLNPAVSEQPGCEDISQVNEIMLKKPAALADFRDLWNLYNQKPIVITADPNTVAPKAFIIGRSGLLRTIDYKPFHNPEAQSGSFPGVRFATPQEQALIGNAISPDHPTLAYFMEEATPASRVLIPVGIAARKPIDIQASLITTHPYWRPGAFSTSFKELYDATSGRQTDSFETLTSYFAAEASKPRTDTFEIFGVKFPVERASGWGIFLIIGIQLYFWVHLHELAPRLEEDDEGWGVAWIGVYRSGPARALFLGSIVALPLVTIGLLTVNALKHITVWVTLTYAFAFITSIGLSLLAVKAVPQHASAIADDANQASRENDESLDS